VKSHFVMPEALANGLDVEARRFDVWLPKDSPFEKRDPTGRCVFATWLEDAQVAKRKGIYIWLLPRRNGWRFLHVGISARGRSTLALRTKHHCRHAFLTDPLPEYCEQSSDFGAIKRQPDGYKAPLDDIIEFLRKIRVLYLLCPENEQSRRLIRPLEGALARGASHAYGGDHQITNTISKVAQCDKSISALTCKELNRVLPILPF
jgi:hypothetical protein